MDLDEFTACIEALASSTETQPNTVVVSPQTAAYIEELNRAHAVGDVEKVERMGEDARRRLFAQSSRPR